MSKIADCKFYGPGREGFKPRILSKTIDTLYGDNPPDWVIVTPYMHAEQDRWITYKVPKSRKWKIAAFTSDIHANHKLKTNPKGYVKALNAAGFDAVLMLYTKLGMAQRPRHKINPDYYLKNLKAKVFHCPPWINTDIFKPVDEPKRRDIAFLGAHQRNHYPLRWNIRCKLPSLAKKNKWKAVIRDRPPGFSHERNIETLQAVGQIVGSRYAETIAHSKTLLFGCSIYKYPLLKYLEGWACKTCVVADKPFTMKRMHMLPMNNFVDIDMKNWENKLTYYLNNDRQREKIAERGYKMVKQYHTTQVRTKELLQFLEENL